VTNQPARTLEQASVDSIPEPVSAISKRKCVAVVGDAQADDDLAGFGNLTALLTRLISTCRMRPASARAASGTVASIDIVSLRPSPTRQFQESRSLDYDVGGSKSVDRAPPCVVQL